MIMNLKYNVIGIILVVVIAGGYVYFSQNRTSDQSPNTVMKEKMVEDGSADMAAMDEKKKDAIIQMILDDPSTIRSGLTNVSERKGMGVGYILRKDGKLYHYVQATLKEPLDGAFYEGWLVNKKPALTFISTGEMMPVGEDSFVLMYEDDEAYEGYNDIVITLETVKDETPEEHILEGTAM